MIWCAMIQSAFRSRFRTDARREDTTEHGRLWLAEDEEFDAPRADSDGGRAAEARIPKRCALIGQLVICGREKLIFISKR